MDYGISGLPRNNTSIAKKIESTAFDVEQDLDMPDGFNNCPLNTASPPDTDPGSADEVVYEIHEVSMEEDISDSDGDPYDGMSEGVVDNGMDFLAFYKSFRDVNRSPVRNKWGIFFVKRRCFAVAKEMSLSTNEPFRICLDALIDLVYAHELYHYNIDAYFLQLESTGGSHIYRPYRSLVQSQSINNWHEEAVANYYGLLRVKSSNINKPAYSSFIQQFCIDLVACSPGAYAAGISTSNSIAARKDLLSTQASQIFSPPRKTADHHELVRSTLRSGTNLREKNLVSMLQLDNCPVYWIDWVKNGSSVIVPNTISTKEFENDFVVRYLSGIFDHKSKHPFYKIDNGELLKLPNIHYKDVKKSEFNNIIGKAGMTSPQFFKARQETSNWRKNVPRSPVLSARLGFREKY